MNGRALCLTPEGVTLRQHAHSLKYNADRIAQKIKQAPPPLAIGATKTIGSYLSAPVMAALLQSGREASLYVDNTQHLLNSLLSGELDIALVEGIFDRKDFAFSVLRSEKLVGICCKDAPFANSSAELSDVFNYRIFLREEGSGTRAVFDNFLRSKNLTTDAFSGSTTVSSFRVICDLVARGLGVSFVYDTIRSYHTEVAPFRIKNAEIRHDFTCVWLHGNEFIHGLPELIASAF